MGETADHWQLKDIHGQTVDQWTKPTPPWAALSHDGESSTPSNPDTDAA
ncbi:MAG: hypothetical protein GY708_07340 [Actinomycetia bacterium]|nr:hypothetical protein [Actinomycetes bacterium]